METKIKFRLLKMSEWHDIIVMLTLESFGWNRTHAAKSLGISIRNMRGKIKALRESGVKVPESTYNHKGAKK